MKKTKAIEVKGREKLNLAWRASDNLLPRLAPERKPGTGCLLPAEEWADNLGCDDIKTPGRVFNLEGIMEQIKEVEAKPRRGYVNVDAKQMSEFFNGISDEH